MDKKILEKVQKILNLAENEGATEHERENAMRQVQFLLGKYNLSMSQVEGHQVDPMTEISMQLNNRYWVRLVCTAIGRLYFCEVMFKPGGHKGCTFFFFGRDTNAKTAQAVSQYVIASVNQEASQELEKTRRQGGYTSGFKIDFCNAAETEIGRRCSQMRKQEKIEDAQTGEALVLASTYEREKKAAIAFRTEKHGQTRKSSLNSRTMNYNENARRSGREYGKNVRLTPDGGALKS